MCIRDRYMCNRACDSCYGNSLDSGRQAYYSCPDPDRRCGTDFPGQYYFYKSEKENIAEEPACYPGGTLIKDGSSTSTGIVTDNVLGISYVVEV